MKTKEEFNLSSKINDYYKRDNYYQDVISAKWVKEFIKRLKEELRHT